MKTAKLEKIMGFMFITGLSMKLLHFPLSGQILILSLGTLAIIYYLSVIPNKIISSELFYNSEEADQISSISRFGFRMSGWGLSFLSIGILFSLQFWEMSRFFLIMGVGSVLFGFIALYKGIRDSLPLVFTRISKRLVTFGVMGLILFSTPRIELFAFFHSDNPDYVEAVRASWANPNDKELHKKVEEFRKSVKSKE